VVGTARARRVPAYNTPEVRRASSARYSPSSRIALLCVIGMIVPGRPQPTSALYYLRPPRRSTGRAASSSAGSGPYTRLYQLFRVGCEVCPRKSTNIYRPNITQIPGSRRGPSALWLLYVPHTRRKTAVIPPVSRRVGTAGRFLPNCFRVVEILRGLGK